MAPILPGLSDDPAAMADVVRAARDAGATSIWANVLYLRPGTREHFLENLARDWPDCCHDTRRCTPAARTCATRSSRACDAQSAP